VNQHTFESQNNAIAIDPNAPQDVYVSGASGVWESTNWGAAFTLKSSWPASSTNLASLIAVSPADSSELYLGTAQGLYTSANGGTTWSASTGLPEASGQPLSIAIDPADPSTVVVGLATGGPQSIFYSTNDLETWQFAGPRFGFGVAVHPSDPARAWFVPAIKDELRVPQDGKFVAARTRDGGKTFESLSNGLPTGFGYDLILRHALDIAETGDTLAFGSTTGNLYVTEDQGDHWHAVTHHLPPVHAVRFAVNG
jgi:photosystem II stability/assembly factor-like uncharacterized protein